MPFNTEDKYGKDFKVNLESELSVLKDIRELLKKISKKLEGG